jgi:hypothetical protein
MQGACCFNERIMNARVLCPYWLVKLTLIPNLMSMVFKFSTVAEFCGCPEVNSDPLHRPLPVQLIHDVTAILTTFTSDIFSPPTRIL